MKISGFLSQRALAVSRYSLAALLFVAGATVHAQTSIEVSTTSQLVNALSTANSSGNTTILLNDGTYTLSDTLYVNGSNITIAGKSGVDVPPGTLNSVLKQAGLKK